MFTRYLYVYMYMHLYIYTCMCICVCVCVYASVCGYVSVSKGLYVLVSVALSTEEAWEQRQNSSNRVHT